MLLIGSRAAKFRIENFRDPLDWDFIASRDEISNFSGLELIKKYGDGKYIFKYMRTVVEVEISENNNSAHSIMNLECDAQIPTPFGVADVASLDVLFLLKRSHIAFRPMWRKHFKDYKELQNIVGCVPNEMLDIFNKRIEETKKRLNFREHNFNVSNDKFFNSRVKRVFDHDFLHEAVKFKDIPIFKMIKKDLNKAEISYEMFMDLPFDYKIMNYQEECMALTLERNIIPCVQEGEHYSERLLCREMLMDMCYNYLPFEFRFFCVDYFEEILNGIPKNFSTKFIADNDVKYHNG